ncbi:MAG: DNA alkylation repair protein [Thermoanaerobaculia bacterium]
MRRPASDPATPDVPVDARARAALASLAKSATKRDRDRLARYGITATNALGAKMGTIQTLAKNLGKSHELAEALWKSEVYEARLLASYVDEPTLVTPAQMDRWCRDFDNWGICDTVCFVLFDRTPHAWTMIAKWAARKNEYEKRAAFALLASLAGHDKHSGDGPFLESLALIERASDDERNFVWKGVSWALRRIGGRSVALHEAALALSKRLAASDEPAARKIGKDAIRDLTSAATMKRLGARVKTRV